MTRDLRVGQRQAGLALVYLETIRARDWADRQYVIWEIVGENALVWQRVGTLLPVPVEDLAAVLEEARTAGLFVCA